MNLHATLSGFRIRASGDYLIPVEVKQSVSTVNSEDLYRLVLNQNSMNELS